MSEHEPPPPRQGTEEGEEERRERARSEIQQAYEWPNPGEGTEAPPPYGIPTETEQQAPPETKEPETGIPHEWRIAIDWIITIGGAILIVLAIKAWVVNPYRIPSSSMEPTLHCAKAPEPNNNGCLAHYSDRVLANRFIYDLESPKRGEIVVFKTPMKAAVECGEGGTFVKRLVGLPFDTVSYNGRHLKVNGELVHEHYIPAGRQGGNTGTWHVPRGRYFFMGDNRRQSCDSRRWGSVPFKNLIGPIFAIYWPPDRIWVATPGLVGGLIIAGIALLIVAAVILGSRRRRTPSRISIGTAAGLLIGLVLEGCLLVTLLVWGDQGTRHAASIVGIAFACALGLWALSLGLYLLQRRPPGQA